MLPTHLLHLVRHRFARHGAPLALLALFSLLAGSLAACSPTSTGGAQLAKRQVLTWPYTGAAQVSGEVLDPAVIASSYDNPTVSMLYAGLVTFNSDLSIAPDAATWTVDSTGTVYTFHLRPELHFNDGTPLTAADYAYSINRALDPALCTVQDAATYGAQALNPNAQTAYVQQCGATPGPGGQPPLAATYLIHILGAKERLAGNGGDDHTLIGSGDDTTHGLDVVDERTLRIRLDAPVAFFLQALTYPTSFPVERKLVEKYPKGLWVEHLDEGGCSGPFKVESYNGGKQLSFTPNTYWEDAFGKKLAIQRVERPMYTAIDDEYTQYRNGALDYTDVPGKQYTFARGQDDFQEEPALTTRYVGLNLNKAPFNNVGIRRAFALALNKQILVDRILEGGALPTNHIIPLGMPGYNTSLKTPPPDASNSLTGNQAAAKQLLADEQKKCTDGTTQTPNACPYITGGAGAREIDVWGYSSNQTIVDIVTAAVQLWNDALGLNVKAKFFNKFGELLTAVYSTAGGSQLQAWNLGWAADYTDPQDWLSVNFQSGSPDDAVNLHDGDVDALLARADKELNTAKRLQMYNQAEQMIEDQAAWIPYAQGKNFWRQRPWVHGFGLNALNNVVDVSWPNVYITQH